MYVLIDGESIHDKEELHDAFSRQLSLPEWYGRNLDALRDCLGDIAEDCEIVLRNRERLLSHLGVFEGAFQGMLRDMAKENPHLTIRCDSSGEV